MDWFWVKDKSALHNLCSALLSLSKLYGMKAAVYYYCFACYYGCFIRSQIKNGNSNVIGCTEFFKRNRHAQFFFHAFVLHQLGSHFSRDRTGGDGIYSYTVSCPFGSQSFCKVRNRGFCCAVSSKHRCARKNRL